MNDARTAIVEALIRLMRGQQVPQVPASLRGIDPRMLPLNDQRAPLPPQGGVVRG